VPVRSRRPTAAQWLAGARLRTLPAAIAPVLAGTGVAAATKPGGVVESGSYSLSGRSPRRRPGPTPADPGRTAVTPSARCRCSCSSGWWRCSARAYLQTRAVTGPGLAVAVAVGSFAGAILVANNLRDVASDGRAGKRTLAVVIGVRRTQVVFGGLLALPFVACLSVAGTHPGALLALGSLPLIVASVRRLAGGATGLALVAVLRETARAELGYAILLAVGLALR
jgi:1,4-dihydroxy-2-naphthoate octaprenyltransferase